MNNITHKPPASEGIQLDSPQDESQKLKRRAENQTIFAFWVAAGAVFCLILAFFNGDSDVAVFLFWACGFLCSTAILFFFFAQLFHIRALLARK